MSLRVVCGDGIRGRPLRRLRSVPPVHSSSFNAPHMKLIRASAHEAEGPGCRRCSGCVARGSLTVKESGAVPLNLISLLEAVQVYGFFCAGGHPVSIHCATCSLTKTILFLLFVVNRGSAESLFKHFSLQ